MKLLRSFVLSAAMAAMVAAPVSQAFAQVGPQASVYDVPAQQRTYIATKLAFSPASSATDFLTIIGSATAPVRIRKVHCDGISTAAATALIQLVKRSAADTGTQVAMTAVPLNSLNTVAATAVVGTYAANPTTGTAVGGIAVGELTTNTAATSSFNNVGVSWDFTNQWVWLNGVAETLAINLNGASLTAGAALNCSVEWSEG